MTFREHANPKSRKNSTRVTFALPSVYAVSPGPPSCVMKKKITPACFWLARITRPSHESDLFRAFPGVNEV